MAAFENSRLRRALSLASAAPANNVSAIQRSTHRAPGTANKECALNG